MSSYFPNALAEFVYYRTYSRFRYDLGRREHWPETVERTINYFREIGENKLTEETYQELHDALLHLRVVPSMRLVTMAGEAARRQNIATYNCSALGISCIDAFGEVLYLLSQGTGVGFSVESWAIDQLPVAHRTSDSNISHHIVVEDSAEGWADAFKEVIRYAYDGVRSVLDVRNIRPAGSILRVKGGRASGPEPLQDLCEFTQNIIIQAGEENRKLKALEVHDICTKIGTVIVSGGVRRCLPAGTRVHTSRGAIPIEDVIVGDLVVTLQGYKPVTATWNQGVQNVVTINLEGNKKFICTPNHKMAVLIGADGSYEFKEASRLEKYDRLIFVNVPTDGVPTYLLPLPEKKLADHSGSKVKQPLLTTNTAWFLGHFFADGYVYVTQHNSKGKQGNSYISTANNATTDIEQIQRCSSWMEEHGLHVSKWGPAEDENCIKLRSSNRQISRWLYQYKQPHKPLVIPEEIWRAPVEIRAAFIAGVMDGDGSFSGGDVRVVSTVYDNFARDIISLLASLGIISEFHITRKSDNREGWQALYTVGIRSRVAQKNFQKIVGKYMCKKFTVNSRSGKGYSIPLDMAKGFVPNSVYRKKWTASSDMNSDTFSNLTGVENYTPVKVLSVENNAQYEQTYDIEVRDNHEFVADGLLVHNSAMISLSNLHDEDMQLAKSGAFWEYTPWRAMANNSAVYINKPSWRVFQKEWNSLAESGTGERGIFNRYGANSRKPERRETYESFITNPCFSAGTMILTKDGHFPIEELVGKTVDIWNGSGWQTVDNFRITGENQPMLKITLESGITERVTPYHTMILQDGTRLAAKDLIPGDKLLVSNAPLISGGIRVSGAYLKGFLIGDGTNGIVQSVKEDGVDDKVYCCTVSGVHALALSCGFMFGQCGEVVLRDAGLCNLCEIIVRSDDSLSSLLEKARIAAIFGTLQSSLTHFPYLRPIWKKNSEEERLLGVSLTGQMDNIHLQQHPEWFQQIKEVVIDTNKQFSKRLGINQSVATTCVKPSGTVSLVVNSSSGVHARWSPYYIRRVRISVYDTLCKLMMAAGAPMVPETGQTKENATTWVIEFPVKSPEGSVYRYDKTAIEQAEYVMMLQKHYAEHSVSATIYVGNDEWDDLGKFIYENFDYVNGMSFLPRDDAIYPLAPYEDIDEDTYNKLVAEFPEIPYDLLYTLEAEDYTEGSQTLACVAGACEVV